tara:strand:- start:5582 stop:5983 length:402 start_codon:yes stop_codon:yes gene_type:complete
MPNDKNYLTPLLPLAESGDLDYKHIDSYQTLVRQNFKNLVLTIPGERMMDTNFGVGIQKYLFENSTSYTSSDISSAISRKAKTYMPFVRVENVLVEPGEVPGSLMVGIFYSVPSLALREKLSLSFSDDGALIS